MRCIQCRLFMCCSLRQTGSVLNMTETTETKRLAIWRRFSLPRIFPRSRQVRPTDPMPESSGESARKKPILGEIQFAGSTAKARKVDLFNAGFKRYKR